jgi:hypothetical protein
VRNRWLALCLGVVGLWGLAGCATTSPRATRQELLERTASQTLYRRPPAEVLQAVRDVLNEQGYTVLPSADPLYVRTSWKIQGDFDSASQWTRYLVVGRVLPDGRVSLRAHSVFLATVGRAPAHPSLGSGSKDSRDSNGTGIGSYVAGEPLPVGRPLLRRALGLEWTVLERLEPRFAAAVAQQVDLYLVSEPQEVDPEEAAGAASP